MAALAAAGCGYHVAGHAAHLPSEWKTIAVPAFQNDTTRYRVEQRFTEAVVREFITRTKYRIVPDAASAEKGERLLGGIAGTIAIKLCNRELWSLPWQSDPPEP